MNKLRFWRLERGLSQHELAEASGMKRWAIQLFETSIRLPSKEEINALAEALGLRVEDLFPGKGSK